MKTLALMYVMLGLVCSIAFCQPSKPEQEMSNIELIISQMREEQNVGDLDPIDPDKISNELLEKLGRELAAQRSGGVLKEDVKMSENERKELYKREGYRYILVNSKIKKIYLHPLNKPGGLDEPETDVTCPKCGNIWNFGGPSEKEKDKKK